MQPGLRELDMLPFILRDSLLGLNAFICVQRLIIFGLYFFENADT